MVQDKIIGRPIRLNQVVLTLQDDKKSAKVMPLGDIHWGSPHCDRPRLRRAIDYCLAHDVNVVLMGDLIESATRESVGSGVYDQDFPGQTQYEQMIELLKPLKDAGLLIGTHQGNHEERIYKMSGVNVSKMFSRELDVPYLGDACWQKWTVGKQTYMVYTMHGRTNARFDGTALLAAERIAINFNCDIFAMGHTHKAIDDFVLMQKVERDLVKEVKKLILLTCGYLKYDDSYAQTAGLPIAKLGSPQITLETERKDFHVNWD